MNRPKQGFSAPVSEWFREELGERARREIRNSSLAERGLLDYDAIDELWRAHRAGRGDWAFQLWNIYNVSAWHDYWIAGRVAYGLRVGLRQGVALWRRAGTRAALRGAAAVGKAAPHARRGCGRDRSRRRPGELRRRSAAPTPVAALRGPVLLAMPTVAAFESRVADGSRPLRRALVERADAIAHRFDLLGSGPTDLGPEIDWSRDFKTRPRAGRCGTARCCASSYGDGSDIKVPWELSRFQHLPLLAAATGTGEALPGRGRRAARELDRGQPGRARRRTGPARWTSRSERPTGSPRSRSRPSVRPGSRGSTHALESLLLHGRFIRTHLEWSEVRGNHYLSDVVGLLPVAALFFGSPRARVGAMGRRRARRGDGAPGSRRTAATTRPRSRTTGS